MTSKKNITHSLATSRFTLCSDCRVIGHQYAANVTKVSMNPHKNDKVLFLKSTLKIIHVKYTIEITVISAPVI